MLQFRQWLAETGSVLIFIHYSFVSVFAAGLFLGSRFFFSGGVNFFSQKKIFFRREKMVFQGFLGVFRAFSTKPRSHQENPIPQSFRISWWYIASVRV